MKKLIMAVTIACAATFANAATVGWTCAALTNYKGDAYAFFVIGQNGVTDMSTITDLLTAGEAYSDYAFGSGSIADNGTATTLASASGKKLDAGTYTGFYAIFDTATATSGTSKYAIISDASGLTRVIAATSATATFTAGNQSTYVSDAANWSSYGTSVPEPTSGLLLLLGMAGMALKRKHA